MGSAPSPLAYTETTSNIKYQLPAWLEASNRWRVAQQDKYLKQQQAMAEGLRSGNKAATYKFLGLPKDATPEQYANAAARFKGQIPYMAQQTATQKAAQGGIMQVRGFAGGGSLTAEEVTFTQKMAKLMEGGGTPTTAQQDRLNAIEKRTDKNVSPFTDVGTKTPGNKAVVKAAESMQKSYTTNTVNPIASESEKYKQPVGMGTIFVDAQGNQVPETINGKPNPAIQGTAIGYTDPTMQAANKAVLNALNTTPTQFQQGSDMMTEAYNALSGLTNFKAPTISATQASASPTQVAQVGNVAHISAPQLQYFQADRGDIRDVEAAKAEAYGYDPTMAEASNYTASQMNAPEGIEALGYDAAQAQASNYQASTMNAPQGIEALGYDAAQMQAAQMNRADVRDIAAKQAEVERYNASLMGAPSDISAQDYAAAQAQAAQAARGDIRDVNAPTATASTYNAALMGAPSDISAQGYTAAQARLNQMQGPKSWTDAGTAQKYMNPYIQNVVDIEKREANRDYQKQLNELNKQAVGAKAYGGSRLAIERAEAARNQATKLADIEAKGLNEAYQQGIGQFATEQSQGLQAGQANLSAAQQTALANQQALNSQRGQFVTQALEAAKNNYGGKLTAEQQNQIAQNATAQFNAQNQTQISQINAQLGLSAQQANQQADIGYTQLNTQNLQQTSLANQAAINAQRSQYVTQALEAAKNNYGGQLTAAQQNQIAQNAAAQFNAQSQNTAYNNYVAQQLAAQQANQGMDFNVGQLNTQNQQAANASNQAAINAQRSQYVTQALQAAQNNYAGQLTAAQQNMIAQNAEAQFNANANMQTSQYNTAAINAQRSQYVTQALEAAKNNYAGELTAEQQNMIARNAEAQFNATANMQTSQYNAASANTAAQYYATARNQAEKDFYAQQFAAQQLNQGMDAQTVAMNLQAQLGVQNTEVGAIMQAATSNQQTDLNRAITQGQLAQNAYNTTATNQANVGIANMNNATAVGQINSNSVIAAGNIALGAGTAMGSTGAGLAAIGTNYGNYLTSTGNLGLSTGAGYLGLSDYLANIKANNVTGATTPPMANPSSPTGGTTNNNTLSGNQLV